jgi:hypothetical protein
MERKGESAAPEKEGTRTHLAGVVDDGLDKTLLLQVLDRDTGERAVDLHAVDENRLRDELEGGDLLHDAVERDLVADHGVVGLVLDLTCGSQTLVSSVRVRLEARANLPFDHFFFFPALP